MRSSALCGSCHTIKLPVYDKNGEKVDDRYEQTTYLEWLNSVYQNEYPPYDPSLARSCQDCHMPPTDGVKISNRPRNLPRRNQFAQHHLVGANTVVLNLIDENAAELGVLSTTIQTSVQRSRALLESEAIAGFLVGAISQVSFVHVRTDVLQVRRDFHRGVDAGVVHQDDLVDTVLSDDLTVGAQQCPGRVEGGHDDDDFLVGVHGLLPARLDPRVEPRPQIGIAVEDRPVVLREQRGVNLREDHGLVKKLLLVARGRHFQIESS